MRVEAKGHDHRICRHNKLAAGDRRRTASSPGVRSAQLGAQKANPVNSSFLVQLKRHRLDVKLKERPLFAGVFDLFFRARHVGFISPIGAGHLAGAVAQRGAHAVHRRIAAAQHHHVQPGGVDIRLLRRCRQPHHLFCVGDEERQRIVDPGGLFVRQPRLHGAIGSGADEHCVIIGQQCRHGDIFPHLAIELKADTHLAEDRPPPGQ